MKRHIKFDVIRVDYDSGHFPRNPEVGFVVAGLDATKKAEFDEEDLPPEVPHMIHEAFTRFGHAGGVFYLAPNGMVYPQFRMEERR